ncbi:hypothetical protein HK101_008164 [Irineochytrium annulatum]|nr:hypothetical protein HK101_008164 [Irineochytrium annulatum]
MPPPSFHIVAGSYERLLFGLDGTLAATDGSPPGGDGVFRLAVTLTPSYIYPSHITCIKSLALTSKLLATGSTDEHVKLYDLSRRKESGSLTHHTGTITALHFHDTTHLITASEDCSIALLRTSDWAVLKTLKGHTSPVTGLACHPSGRLLLSVSTDGFMRLWDLMKGNCAHTTRLKGGVGFRVRWGPAGNRFGVLMDRSVQVWDRDLGEVVKEVGGVGRLNCLLIVKARRNNGEREGPERVVVGGDDGCVTVWTADAEAKLLARWRTGHGARVKDMDFVEVDGVLLLVTCSTDGGVRVWDLDAVEVECAVEAGAAPKVGKELSELPSPGPLASYEATCRLTCLVVGETKFSGKRRQSEALSVDASEDFAEAIGEDDHEEMEQDHPEAETSKNSLKMSVTFDGAATNKGKMASGTANGKGKETRVDAPAKKEGPAGGPLKSALKKSTMPPEPQQKRKKQAVKEEDGGGGKKRAKAAVQEVGGSNKKHAKVAALPVESKPLAKASVKAASHLKQAGPKTKLIGKGSWAVKPVNK